jgi:hypothetical protein
MVLIGMYVAVVDIHRSLEVGHHDEARAAKLQRGGKQQPPP